MLRLKIIIFLTLFLGVFINCNNDSPNTALTSIENILLPENITFSGVGSKGIFDPAVTYEPSSNLLWMSFSEVGNSVMWPDINDTIQTKLSFSNDQGSTWQNANISINNFEDVDLPVSEPNNKGTWNNEVSSIVYDVGAPIDERWKVLWHHYLWINGSRAFEHGWIAMKTAASPQGPWSTERKLFVGSIYDTVNDSNLGVPEVQLDQLNVELNGCLTFTEPGMLATSDSLYVVLLCAEGASTNGKIILLKWAHSGSSWEYLGTLLNNSIDGPLFGFDGFSAGELFEKDSEYYLIVTPQTADKYLGTYIFEIENLETATLKRTDGKPDLIYQLNGTTGSHNGASTYTSQAIGSGIMYSEFLTTENVFKIYSSHKNP